MKERNERIEQLLERYYDAQTTDAEERELRDYFRYGGHVSDSLRYAQAMFSGMDALAQESVPEKLSGEPTAGHAARSRRMRLVWSLTAFAAVLALGLFLHAGLHRKPYCYIDGVAVYDKQTAMQTTVYLQGFSGFEDPASIVDELIINE
ncbi:hypothetical protein [uncultured Alistipes sp.]|jgi:hypothetical protein|uniref:hypothetical protein n=1 Tax=uncultured Alistipes sp. TaxID=538949 RepID=UPI0025D85E16|nr:hypothetical protein [uncultured Alistipes sp.]